MNTKECNTVIKQNINKAFIVAQGKYLQDGVLLPLPETLDILNMQLSQIATSKTVSVLSTCVFFIAEYDPKLLND